jgi:chromate transporter
MTTVYAQLIVIVLGAALGFIFCQTTPSANAVSTQQHTYKFRVSRTAGAVALTLFCLLLFGLPALAAFGAGHAISVFDAFYRSGALVFGGGHVVLPLLQQQTVATGWVTSNDFLAGYGAAQAVPGPLFTFAAFLGWMMSEAPNHWNGALLAIAGIFLPGLLLVLSALPYWQAMRARPSTTALLSGVNAAVVGLLGTALYSPVWTSAISSATDFAIASVGFFLLTRWKIPPIAVVVLCALAGIAEAVLH